MRVEVSRQQVAAIQGLTQRLTAADGTVEERIVAQIEAPADAQAEAVEWEGVLRLEHGSQLDLIAQGGLQVSVDGKPFSGPAYLGRGIYSLHILRPAGSTGQARLLWKLGDQEAVTIPPEALFHIPLPRTGLLSSYYPNQNWEGEPVFQQVTPFLLLAWPDETPLVSVNQFSARYQGILQITKAGNYLLRVEADDGARLTLDGVVIGEGLVAGQPNSFETDAPTGTRRTSDPVGLLPAGWRKHVALVVESDDQPLAPIPPDCLIPARP